MASATATIRLGSEEKALISDYAAVFGTSVSEFMRKAALERIEDELDLKGWVMRGAIVIKIIDNRCLFIRRN